MSTLTLTKTASGWSLILTKTAGLNKGTTTIATFCDGNLGKRMAIRAANAAAADLMVDRIALED